MKVYDIEGLDPVSYTHLDVYKRQLISFCAVFPYYHIVIFILQISNVMLFCKRNTIITDFFRISRTMRYATDFFKIMPVSYTHLDVYKRQSLHTLKTSDSAANTASYHKWIFLLSDYGKGLFDGRTAPDVIARCRAARKPVIVDPKGADYSRYRGATLVKPNMKEFQEATGVAE